MRKGKISWSRIVVIAILLVMALLVFGMYTKLVELTSHITYLQDTTNIILADVGGMESTITQTLQEENGMVEHYSIKMVDMDFAANTYDVSVYMIPKEYTDSTAISVYFGTQECPLERDGYAYTGQITLPLNKSFDGNLTFLFADGKKKNTEVYSNYDGIQTYLEEVLSGRTAARPKYEDGVLSIDGAAEFDLDGRERYEFDRFELAAMWNEEEVWTQDLVQTQVNDDGPQQDASGVEATEAAANAVVELPFGGMSGTAEIGFRYEPKEAGKLRLYLRAVSVEGYRFEYDLLTVGVVEEEREDGEDSEGDGSEEPALKLDEESLDRNASYVVYDKKGGKRKIK